MNTPLMIGITGGSASGKTFFLKSLISAFQENELCVVSQDDYYHEIEKQPKDEMGIENFDTPHSIDLNAFVSDINSLKAGKQVLRKEYTFNNPAITPKTLVFNPAPAIIIEGIYIFYHPEILNLLDLKIYIDAKEHVKLIRRISRDGKERGYSIEDVLYRYEKHVSPNYEKYIEPFKDEADIIIPNNYRFDKGLDLVKTYIREKIKA